MKEELIIVSCWNTGNETFFIRRFTFKEPLEPAPLLAILFIDEFLIMIGAAPLGGFGGNGGRLECGSEQMGRESSRFLSCMYSSIKVSNFVSTSSTYKGIGAVSKHCLCSKPGFNNNDY